MSPDKEDKKDNDKPKEMPKEKPKEGKPLDLPKPSKPTLTNASQDKEKEKRKINLDE